MARLALVLLALLVATLVAPIRGDKEVLVLVENTNYASTHSLFFAQLSDAGYQLDVRAADDKTLRLRDWDTWIYSKLIIFASAIHDYGGAVDSELILEFIDSGHDLLIAVDSHVSDELRGLIGDLGVDVEPKGSAVRDHVGYVQSGGEVDHTVIASGEYGAIDGLFSSGPPEASTVFQGIGMSIPSDSKQVLNALGGSSTTFSALHETAITDAPNVAAAELALVAAIQARNNGRVVVAGSTAMFSNAFWRGPLQQHLGTKHAAPGNRELCIALVQWVFHLRGQLWTSGLRHHRVGETQTPAHYRVSDELEVSLDIKELVGGVWQPYQATDVQVEFVMLDPYVRQTLSPTANGTFSTTINVPDVYGVFKFVVDYARAGYSTLELSEQVPVRPFRHNEYERFIPSAYPYYVSVLSLMAAFVLLDFLFLYRK
ncbi:hypothetical protein WJX73_004381 [Symbiochloris irregularis]|uniref:Dolichyl-diphosphooligosaccharide--protein glycosyltransferase 48 kDa subunit n=1 Tax=Symbiochloris irregularis TaxID=706552 RepID=A0AAW1NR73_9CHLO